jgi:cytochrome c553
MALIDDSETKSEEATAMHKRFLAVNSIRDAVITGDLAVAKQLAEKLANNKELLSVFADWGLHTKDMQKEIEQVAASTDLRSASAHTAAAARTCGRCHEALGVATLDEKSGQPPSESDDIGGIMRRHQWAINRMWVGLIAPSNSSWMAGAKELTEIAYQAQNQPEAKSNKELPSLLSEIEKLAVAAAKAVTNPEKTQVFGQLLTTCSGCHQKMRPDGGKE